MTRTIREAASCPAEFRFYINRKELFCLCSQNASFEYEYPFSDRERKVTV